LILHYADEGLLLSDSSICLIVICSGQLISILYFLNTSQKPLIFRLICSVIRYDRIGSETTR